MENYSWFFEPVGNGGDIETDYITGEPLTEYKHLLDNSDEPERKKYINHSTWEQIELGKKLKNSDYWIITKEKIDYWKDYSFEPANLGIYHYFINTEQLSAKKENLKASVDHRFVKVLNNTNFLESAIQGINNIYAFEYYGGNDYPADDDGSPLTFDKLAKSDTGIDRLGILRMDIDNLGQIIINGFEKNKRTFSRYSTLSRNLDWFFKGYLNTIWNSERFNNKTQIIYSGGDDLFIVGQWNTLIEMAEKINKKFSEWVCHNPKLTLSGGLAIVSPKYPVLKGARVAGEAEEQAKNYTLMVDGKKMIEKNAFSIFNYALGWQNEYAFVKTLKDKISRYLIDRKLPKSFISKIMSHYSSIRKFEPDIEPLNVFWLSAYDLGRMQNRIKDKEVKEFVGACKKAIYMDKFENFNCKKDSNYHFIQLLYFASRWADFETRK